VLIAGWVKTSLVDYPEKISSVVFTQGCNMNCFYCHNKELIPLEKESKFDEVEILQWLRKRSSIVEGVVVTGGEPTLQKDLGDFLKSVKKLGLKTKLDTNGTQPEVLEKLLEDGMLDFIAMDIKAPLEKYSQICGKSFDKSFDKSSVEESLTLIRNSKIDHEFRTTLAPGLNPEDIRRILTEIAGDKNYILQKCRGYKNTWRIDEERNCFKGVTFRGF
jgi:pyruvate formate lyase activating enzyme